MRQPDDAGLLLDIVLAAEDAREFIAGVTYDDYLDDKQLQLALAKLIEIMGEAARNLSHEMRSATAHIPWGDITGMRHRLVHDYRNIDLELIWQTVEDDLPKLLDDLRPLLAPRDA